MQCLKKVSPALSKYTRKKPKVSKMFASLNIRAKPLLTGASFCSCVKCYYYAQFLKITPTQDFSKLDKEMTRNWVLQRSMVPKFSLPCRNCKSMYGSLDCTSCLLIRNPNLPCELFWVTSDWSSLKSSFPDLLACLFTPRYSAPYICPCWLLLF